MVTWMRPAGRIVAVATMAAFTPTLALAGPPLKRTLASYFVFAMQTANLKNTTLLGACNAGVNCDQPSSNDECGVISHEDPFYADGSQIVGDVTKFTKPGGNVAQVFSNQIPDPGNVTVRMGTSALTPLPVIGDLDMDGTPSCRTAGGRCLPDAGDLAKGCGFPAVFPPCGGANVSVQDGADCAANGDPTPGNGRCDLPPGTYGILNVANGAALALLGGNYAFCAVQIGRNTTTFTLQPSTLHVSGDVNIGNGSIFGQECGDISVLVAGDRNVSLGKHSSIVSFLCAPESRLGLGNDNSLKGRFFADRIHADRNVIGNCCGGACACFDAFTPDHAPVGGTVTLTSECDLSGVLAVRICGFNATILSQTPQVIQVRVPAGAAGSCIVEVDSDAGTFTHNMVLGVP